MAWVTYTALRDGNDVVYDITPSIWDIGDLDFTDPTTNFILDCNGHTVNLGGFGIGSSTYGTRAWILQDNAADSTGGFAYSSNANFYGYIKVEKNCTLKNGNAPPGFTLMTNHYETLDIYGLLRDYTSSGNFHDLNICEGGIAQLTNCGFFNKSVIKNGGHLEMYGQYGGSLGTIIYVCSEGVLKYTVPYDELYQNIGNIIVETNGTIQISNGPFSPKGWFDNINIYLGANISESDFDPTFNINQIPRYLETPRYLGNIFDLPNIYSEIYYKITNIGPYSLTSLQLGQMAARTAI